MDQPITTLGETNFRGQRRTFGIYEDDRRRHVYVIGKTGVGKTTFLENVVAQDIVEGRGVCFIDPHGDAVEKLLNSIPPERVNDVVYFDPSDVDNPVAFNILEATDPQYKYLVASGLVSSLKKIWADSWGPRLEYILRNTILALLDYPSSTILGILRMLADKSYRTKVVKSIEDPVIKSFWVNEFAQYNERFRSEAISPIQNKVGQLLSSAIIRNIMAQPKSTIDMHEIMNEGKILLVNVSKGKIGEDNSALLGAMIINRIQLAAMDRASIPEEERKDFYLYVDEFQNFATESFADILSEARKYRLNLLMAHQYVAQMEEPVRDAVFGNVGTLVSFRVGAADAEYLEKEFAPSFTETDLVNLDKYNAYIKLMINGISSKPFSMRTQAPTMENFGKAEVVRQVSRERYGRKREIIEDKIRRWSGAEDAPSRDDGQKQQKSDSRQRRDATAPNRDTRKRRPEPAGPPKAEELADVVISSSEQEITDLSSLLKHDKESHASDKRFSATCAECGEKTEVPFKPDPDRPVYCKECHQKKRLEKRPLKQPDAEPMSAAEKQPQAHKASAKVFHGPKPPAV